MPQKLILFLSFSLSSSLFAAPVTLSGLKSHLQKVSTKNLTDWVNELVKVSAPSRMVGKTGHDKARDFIKESISKNDPKNTGKITITSNAPDIEAIKKFYQNDFDQKVGSKIPMHDPLYVKWSRFTASMQNLATSKKDFPVQNIIWEKTGVNSEKILVVTAHYDTISHDKETLLVNEASPMPGANYNASGVAILLGLIKMLSTIELNYTVRVVFLDWQGIGFHGSYLYAKELKNSGKTIMGVINLEMLGQDSSYFDKTKKTGNLSVYVRDLDHEKKWVRGLTDIGQKMTKKVEFQIKPNGFDSSDNFRFWEQGFLSATFSQNWEDDFNPKFYQTPEDTPETLNHGTLWHAYQHISGAVIGTLLDLR